MIHEIGVELQAALRANGCPLSVVDRESTKTATWARERIVIEHDGDDSFGAARSQHWNPKQRMTRSIGVKVTIFAQTTKSGALEWEHRRRAEAILDQVLVGLELVARRRRNAVEFKGGKFIEPDDLAKSDVRGGAVYELSVSIDRAVNSTTWAGDAEPEFTLASGSIQSRTMVSRQGAADDDDDPNNVPASAVTACGD